MGTPELQANVQESPTWAPRFPAGRKLVFCISSSMKAGGLEKDENSK